jgi:hypothetical protein
LLGRVVRDGRLERPLPSLDEIRRHCTEQLAGLPEQLLRLDPQQEYPVTYSARLEADASRLIRR